MLQRMIMRLQNRDQSQHVPGTAWPDGVSLLPVVPVPFRKDKMLFYT